MTESCQPAVSAARHRGLVSRATEWGQQWTWPEYDGNRRLADTASSPVGYVDVGTGRPALFVHGVGTSGLL